MRLAKLFCLTWALTLLLAGSAVAENPAVQRQIDESIQQWLRDIDSGVYADRAAMKAQTEPARALTAPATAGSFVCLPSCSTTDGRFLSIAGEDLQTLAGDSILLRISAPADLPSFTLGFFDGDSGGVWDLPTTPGGGVPLFYELLADPNTDGLATTLVAQWMGNTLADNAWSDFTIATGPEAQAPSGNYFYLLRVSSTDFTAVNNWSNFKIRTSGQITSSVSVSPVAFAFTGPLFSPNEGLILFPNAGSGDFTSTTYDGSWSFFLDAFQSLTRLEMWDGDFDRGRFDGTDLDTDDPDTPGIPFLPPWAVGTTARPEGVAFVLTCGSPRSATGCPADDAPAGVLTRSPSIQYAVTTPTGQMFANDNPSGNREWEQFLISTAPFDRQLMDSNAPSLPPGFYRVDATGVDLNNLNSWRFFSAVVGVCEDGTPCAPILRPYLVGDTVFLDTDGDGIQDLGESGIAGVVVELRGFDGALLATTTTDASGFYSFEVEAGTLTVQVAAGNFGPGGALEGTVVTTLGGNAQTDTVVTENILTYDFGYRGTGSIGNFVWLDANSDGIDNDGAGSGIGGVQLILTQPGPDGVFGTVDDVTVGTTVTDASGFYDFTGLLPGSYRVDVDESTLPAGLQLTTGNEPFDVVLGPGDNVDNADFGYVGLASVGDRVWSDVDGDGVQEPGEPGINGVTVSLLDASGAVIATTVTSGDGGYSFRDLSPGTYTVVVDSNTVPAGLAQTYDLDGLASRDRATVTLAAGDDNTLVDFGYGPCGQCEGKVSHLTLLYLGPEAAYVEAIARRGSSRDVVFSGMVPPGGTIDLIGPNTGNGGFFGTLGTEVTLKVDRVEHTTIHTSCSVPIGPGLVSGDFVVVSGSSRHGGLLCPVGGDPGGEEPPPPPPDEVGTGTIGYWKNHPEAWPVDFLLIGGQLVSKQMALTWLNTPVRGDMSIALFQQLVATKLNLESGTESSCIVDTVIAADTWLASYPVGSGVRSKSWAWKWKGAHLHQTLDDYNNGLLCAPHRS